MKKSALQFLKENQSPASYKICDENGMLNGPAKIMDAYADEVNAERKTDISGAPSSALNNIKHSPQRANTLLVCYRGLLQQFKRDPSTRTLKEIPIKDLTDAEIEWVYGLIVDIDTAKGVFVIQDELTKQEKYCYLESMAAFSGRYDTKGKRIFHGDICSHKSINFTEPLILIVRYDIEHCAYALKEKTKAGAERVFSLLYEGKDEVLGNELTTPELIKQIHTTKQ